MLAKGSVFGWQMLRPAAALLLLLTLITGVLYPLLLTGLAQGLFAESAAGSWVRDDRGVIIGSRLIGQPFSQPQYFWSRPSATLPQPYNASASAGSPFGPRHPQLLQQVSAGIAALHRLDPDNPLPIPVDLVTRSGSGLDPHISVAAAQYQIARIARSRQLDSDRLQALVALHTQPRQFGVLGEPCVNVLLLNRALDAWDNASNKAAGGGR